MGKLLDVCSHILEGKEYWPGSSGPQQAGIIICTRLDLEIGVTRDTPGNCSLYEQCSYMRNIKKYIKNKKECLGPSYRTSDLF